MSKCKVCKSNFVKKFPNEIVCGYQCAVIYAREKREKEVKRKRTIEKKELKEKLKTKSDYLKEVQKEFNKYIRLRDKELPCISCGTKKNIKFDAGHFYSVGAYPNLRFNEDNCHKQCSNNCNVNLSGNIHEYRLKLILKIGQERFDNLERLKGVKSNYSIPELKELKEIYKNKIKQLK